MFGHRERPNNIIICKFNFNRTISTVLLFNTHRAQSPFCNCLPGLEDRRRLYIITTSYCVDELCFSVQVGEETCTSTLHGRIPVAFRYQKLALSPDDMVEMSFNKEHLASKQKGKKIPWKKRTSTKFPRDPLPVAPHLEVHAAKSKPGPKERPARRSSSTKGEE